MTKLEVAAHEYACKIHKMKAPPQIVALAAFQSGAEWMRSETINKACEWLEERQLEDLEVPNIEKFIDDFKKYLEEQR